MQGANDKEGLDPESQKQALLSEARAIQGLKGFFSTIGIVAGTAAGAAGAAPAYGLAAATGGTIGGTVGGLSQAWDMATGYGSWKTDLSGDMGNMSSQYAKDNFPGQLSQIEENRKKNEENKGREERQKRLEDITIGPLGESKP